MSLRGRFFAMTYDRQLAKVEAAGLGLQRERLLEGAHGDVLEIGAGTGANLRFYGAGIETLTMTEPEPPMVRRLQKNVREKSPLTKVLRAPAEDLPFNEESFDTVVSTLVLCGVEDQTQSLQEIRRVLRPGGQLLFLEHVRSAETGLARKQDRINWLNRLVAGCDCNRSTLEAITAAGFTITGIDHSHLEKVPQFVSPLIVGQATPTATVVPSPVAVDSQGDHVSPLRSAEP